MGTYPDAAVERAMQVQEVLLRAMSGQVSWWQAAEILGISDRSMRRWRERLEKDGYDGLFYRQRQLTERPRSDTATPVTSPNPALSPMSRTAPTIGAWVRPWP